MSYLKKVVERNLDGLAYAVALLATHDGEINYSMLDRVKFQSNDMPVIERGKAKDGCLSKLSIMIGGEIPNSIMPLYEFTYFTQAWITSAVATIILSNLKYQKGVRQWQWKEIVEAIRSEICALSEDKIRDALIKPEVAIVSNLDTDIEAYRYAKHGLWNIPAEKLTLRCNELVNNGQDFNANTGWNLELDSVYYTDEDRSIARIALLHAETLPQAKEIQYALSLRKLLSQLGVDINDIPLYFHKVPKEELVPAGPETLYLKALLELHRPSEIKKYAKIVKRKQPWLIGLPCPNCGERSKRIINYRLKKGGEIVRASCSSEPSSFIREDGSGFDRAGCGEIYEFDVPSDIFSLYDFINDNSITINFPARDLLGVLKGTVYQPAIWMVTDVGVTYRNGLIYRVPDYPVGFGDHLDMITSTIEMHTYFISGQIASCTSFEAQKNGMLLSRQVSIFGNTSPTNLTDNSVVRRGTDIHVTDTSSMKILSSGESIYEAVNKSIDINYFSISALTQAKYQ